jgi:5-methylcytosine-specific restriction endonuclease McrA
VSTDYIEKLKDPRWQRRRCEIMYRDGYICQKCGDETISLNVHHVFYYPGLEPWEYEDNDLITLCENCHGRHHVIENFQDATENIIEKPYNTDRSLFVDRMIIEYGI